ncbi:MAG: lipopolysaccharide biosynthesis protein [Proteobacteria bacterium]|nr:lipopolysaccharide biosynthesis protein [Pseudomonadota bacterium]
MTTDASALVSPADGDFLDASLTLAEHARLLILIPIVVGLLTLGITFLITPTFTATTSIMTPQKSDSAASLLLGSLSGLAGTAAGSLAGLKNPADQWVGLLQSRTIADALINKFKLRERYNVEYMFKARKILAKLTDIQAGKDGLITIDVLDEDPEVAKQMADSYVDELQKLSRAVALTESSQRRAFFEERLKDTQNKLDQAAAALQKSGIGQSTFKTDPGAAVDAVARLRGQIVAAEVRVSVMRNYMTEQSPDLRLAQKELSSLRQQLSQIEHVDDPAQAGGEAYVAKYRDFKYYESLYELIAKQYELAKIDEARDGTVIQVVDHAVVPEWKTNPKRGLMSGLAALLSLILTGLYFLGRESIRRRAVAEPAAGAKFVALRRALSLRRRRSASRSGGLP